MRAADAFPGLRRFRIADSRSRAEPGAHAGGDAARPRIDRRRDRGDGELRHGASAFLALGQGKTWGERVPEREVLLDIAQPIGHDYWHLMNLAGRYAYAGREWVARRVISILGGTERELVHNHHNFAWKETHGGEEVVVVRKGATPAFPVPMGFVGASMGDDAVILRGGGLDESPHVYRRLPEVLAAQ